jgi:SAM-dependent methyltransferase
LTDRGTFDSVADRYDDARPEYPDELVDEAVQGAGLGAGDRVLEVGCGTGKLTRKLVDRGLDVDALDASLPMLEEAERLMPPGSRPHFQHTTFELAPVPDEPYHALFSATAFHWVDPGVAWYRAAEMLRPGGLIALFSHIGGPFLDFEPEFWDAWREVSPDAAGYESVTVEELWEHAEARVDNISRLWGELHLNSEIDRSEAAELFGDVTLHSMTMTFPVTADDAIALVRTQAAYTRLDEDERRHLESRIGELVASRGGSIASPLYVTSVTARRR